MKCCLRSDGEIVSPLDFGIWTHAYLVPKLMVYCFGLVEMSLCLENMVDWVDMVDKEFENLTRGT